MKILLTAINARYIHSNLAVYSLRAYAKAYARHIELVEFTINHRVEFILQEIYKQKPDVLCFSCYIWNLSYVEELIEEYHKLCPHVPIWTGGPEASYEVEQFLKTHSGVTGVMIGEGEQTFLELCAWYVKQMERTSSTGHIQIPDAVFGIACRKQDGEIFFTPPQKPVDLNDIPFYYENMSDFENRIIYYESSRGCPFSCSYCLSSVEKTLRFRNPELVRQELLFFIQNEVPQVKFVDRTFNCNKKHAMEIWRFIKEQDKGITNFHFEIAADLLTEDELELLSSMRQGLVQLEIGVQSAHAPTIQEIHRTMQLDKVKTAVKRVQNGGNIHQHLDLIAGLPFEDFQTFQKSFDAVYALKPEQLQLGFLKVLKGSYIYEHQKDYGLIYHTKPPYEVMRTRWLDYDDILKIKAAEEMLEVYYNSGQFAVAMKILELAFESAFEMYLKLGMFYEKNGYNSLKHTRIRRCEILLEFIQEADAERMELYQEALTMDLYLRENLKSRPFWAPSVQEWKAVSKAYCKNGRLSHIEPFHYEFPPYIVKSLTDYPQKKERYFVHFDYENRNRLTHAAGMTIISGGNTYDKKNRTDTGKTG